MLWPLVTKKKSAVSGHPHLWLMGIERGEKNIPGEMKWLKKHPVTLSSVPQLSSRKKKYSSVCTFFTFIWLLALTFTEVPCKQTGRFPEMWLEEKNLAGGLAVLRGAGVLWEITLDQCSFQNLSPALECVRGPRTVYFRAINWSVILKHFFLLPWKPSIPKGPIVLSDLWKIRLRPTPRI